MPLTDSVLSVGINIKTKKEHIDKDAKTTNLSFYGNLLIQLLTNLYF